MISYVLLIISICIVSLLYLFLGVMYLCDKTKKVDKYNGFDIAKEVTSNYDDINIVVSNDIVFSEYDINRKVIRLNNNNYDGNTVNDLVISSLLAGYSLVNNENPNYFKFNFIFKKIRSISFILLVMMVLSYFINNIGDAKIGVILFILLLVVQYMRYLIAVSAKEKIENNIDKELYLTLEKGINRNIFFNKMSFIVSLIMVLRLVVIILGI